MAVQRSDASGSGFLQPMPYGTARVLPWATVMAGSLVATLPVGLPSPLLPPFGLLVLLAWRQLAPLAIRRWAPALLGLFDDLVSGQPVGSAMLLWTACFFLVQALEARSGVRDFWQGWAISALAIAVALGGGRLIAARLGAHVDLMLSVQIVVSILLFPAVARTIAWIDAKRAR